MSADAEKLSPGAAYVRGVVGTALRERRVGLDTERWVLQELDAALRERCGWACPYPASAHAQGALGHPFEALDVGMTEPRTRAAQTFLGNLVGRFGGSAMDPVSWELTVDDLRDIEREAVDPLLRLVRAADVLANPDYAVTGEQTAWANFRAALGALDPVILERARKPAE